MYVAPAALGVPVKVNVAPIVVIELAIGFDIDVPVPPTCCKLTMGATKNGVGNTIATVGLAPGVPAVVMVN
jgi:hypothetical protein